MNRTNTRRENAFVVCLQGAMMSSTSKQDIIANNKKVPPVFGNSIPEKLILGNSLNRSMFAFTVINICFHAVTLLKILMARRMTGNLTSAIYINLVWTKCSIVLISIWSIFCIIKALLHRFVWNAILRKTDTLLKRDDPIPSRSLMINRLEKALAHYNKMDAVEFKSNDTIHGYQSEFLLTNKRCKICDELLKSDEIDVTDDEIKATDKATDLKDLIMDNMAAKAKTASKERAADEVIVNCLIDDLSNNHKSWVNLLNNIPSSVMGGLKSKIKLRASLIMSTNPQEKIVSFLQSDYKKNHRSSALMAIGIMMIKELLYIEDQNKHRRDDLQNKPDKNLYFLISTKMWPQFKKFGKSVKCVINDPSNSEHRETMEECILNIKEKLEHEPNIPRSVQVHLRDDIWSRIRLPNS